MLASEDLGSDQFTKRSNSRSSSRSASGRTSPTLQSTEEIFPHVDRVENFIHSDAEVLMHHFKDSYDKVIDVINHPRVLIAGVAGAGKSSIINSVFGSEIAKEGAGKPITQHFQKFEPEDSPIILYDSKGLEVGMQLDECIRSTREYFTQCNNGEEENCVEKQVDLVWYIVNSAAARFQDFEEEFCKSLFKNIPIIFLLNKSDISTEEQREALRAVIAEMELKNCLGIFDVITQKYCSSSAPTKCSACGSEDLIVFRKKKISVCEDCAHTTSTELHTGLDTVIETAFAALPKIVKESFVAAQRVSFKLKEKRAKRCILDFYHDQTHTLTTHGLLSILATMLTRLSFVWDFKEHAHLSATMFARDVVGSFSIRDKIFLFMHKNKHQRLRATGIGIIWNRCVRELATIMLIESVEGVPEKTAEDQWPLILRDVFQFLSAENIDHIETLLRTYSLDEVLASEMPVNGGSEVNDSEPNVDLHRSSIPSLYAGANTCWDGWLSPMRKISTPSITPPREEEKEEEAEEGRRSQEFVRVNSENHSVTRNSKKKSHKKHHGHGHRHSEPQIQAHGKKTKHKKSIIKLTKRKHKTKSTAPMNDDA